MTVIEKRVENGRLVWFRSDADDGFWTRTWDETFDPVRYQIYKSGLLDEYEDFFVRWLPNDAPVLEAGCGLSHYVLALRVRGYDAEGVDISERSIRMVKECCPNLPIRFADVRNLDVADDYYGGYVSLGVIEHLREGPEPFLKEAFRILRPGGRAVVTVPWFHPLRRLKAVLGSYRGGTSRHPFYQYAFTKKEIVALMQECGFAVLETGSIAPFKGLKDEVPLVAWLASRPGIGLRFVGVVNAVFRALPWLGQRVGHMLLIVAQKPAS